jgi:excisionase family DNA binding protein
MPDLMKPGEAMRVLGVSRKKLRMLVAAGALRRVRFPGRGGRPAGYSWFMTWQVERLANTGRDA